MRIREIITETRAPEEIQEMLLSECGPFINEMGGFDAIKKSPVVRGDNRFKSFDPYIKIQCPVNRGPMDTTSRIHKIADDWFDRKFGIRFRSNVLFGSGNVLAAQFYGNLGLLFPIGEYHYCWSPRFTDLFVLSDLIDTAYSMPEHIESHLENGDYQFDTGLHEAIKNGSEVMFNCQSAYMVSPEVFGIKYK